MVLLCAGRKQEFRIVQPFEKKMNEITDQTIKELASRYGVSSQAVMTLLRALVNGGGTMAQFDHSELGGMGQWSRRGMTMVGDMFNDALKAKVNGLADDLSHLLH